MISYLAISTSLPSHGVDPALRLHAFTSHWPSEDTGDLQMGEAGSLFVEQVYFSIAGCFAGITALAPSAMAAQRIALR